MSTSKMEFHLKAWEYDTLISESVRVEPELLNCQHLILQLLKPPLQKSRFNHFWWVQSFWREEDAENIHLLKSPDLEFRSLEPQLGILQGYELTFSQKKNPFWDFSLSLSFIRKVSLEHKMLHIWPSLAFVTLLLINVLPRNGN